MVQTHTTDTYPFRVRSFFCITLSENIYMVHPLVPTTNAPNGSIHHLWTPLTGHKTTKLYPLGLQLRTN